MDIHGIQLARYSSNSGVLPTAVPAWEILETLYTAASLAMLEDMYIVDLSPDILTHLMNLKLCLRSITAIIRGSPSLWK